MYRRILVAVDGSSTSNKALVAALQMTSYSGGRSTLRLIHVLDELAYLTGYDPYGSYSSELISVMREAGEKILVEALAIAQSAGVQADTLLIDELGERLGQTVANAAKLWNADLIVVGTHGRRGVSRMLLGSGAEQIVRLAPIPVLVVRDSDSQDSL